MTFQLRKSRRDPGSPICSNCCSVTYKQRWTLSFGHGQFRKFKTQRILKPGERWLCQAGHDQDEYEKVVSDEEKDEQEPIVQRAKLVCTYYEPFDLAGDTEKCIKAIFSVAEGFERALIYLDEIDCMLAQSSDNLTSSSSTLEILLKSMNKLLKKNNDRIILVSSTNRPDLLPENLVSR